jgi:HK97 family phage portal protein
MNIPFFAKRQSETQPQAKALPAEYEGGRGWDYLYGLVKKWSGQWKGSSTIFSELSVGELEQAFGTHPVVYSCVDKTMKALAQARWEVGLWKDEETWTPLKSVHPVLDLIEQPNASYSRSDFMQYLSSHLLLTGCSYVWKLRNGTNKVSELWPIPTSWVTPAKGSGTVLIGSYRVTGNQAPVDPRDMGVCRFIDPSSTAGFVAPLNAAFRDYRLDGERENYLAEMLVNMKLPSMVVRPKGTGLTPAQAAEARQTLDERVGRGKRGNALLMPRECEVDIVNPLSDLDWPGLTSLIETRICAALGTPAIIAGVRAGLDRATYSNYEQAKRAWYTGTLAPLWDMLAAALTMHLLRAEGEKRLELRARYDELPEFQEDKTAAANRATTLFNADIISRDEAREDIDLPPDPEWEPRQPAVVAPPAQGGGDNQGDDQEGDQVDGGDPADLEAAQAQIEKLKKQLKKLKAGSQP